MSQQGPATHVPRRVAHVGVAFTVLAAIGAVAFLCGILLASSEPRGLDNISAGPGLLIVFGTAATLLGCIAAPFALRNALRDREGLALVLAHRPHALPLPGEAGNPALRRSLVALGPSVSPTPSVVWSVDELGMELWQRRSAVPVLIIEWNQVVSICLGIVAYGRAVNPVVVLELEGGHQLRLAFRRRFGGIFLMSRARLEDVIRDLRNLRKLTQPQRDTMR